MEAWTTIRYLHAQGLGIRAICRELSVSRKAVRRALRTEEVPRSRRPRRPNLKLAPFEAQIRALYFREHLIGSRIIRELRGAGYGGSASAVYAYLKGLRAVVRPRRRPSGSRRRRAGRASSTGHRTRSNWAAN
jgi:transposase